MLTRSNPAASSSGASPPVGLPPAGGRRKRRQHCTCLPNAAKLANLFIHFQPATFLPTPTPLQSYA